MNILWLLNKNKRSRSQTLGGQEISDRLFLTSWLICEDEHVLLEEKDIVRDVLKFPKHSKESPEFMGSCQSNGQDLPGTALGVLKNEPGAQMLSAVVAWEIDEKQNKFVELKTDGLRCSRDGIIIVDGAL